jgi:hypothetical protein
VGDTNSGARPIGPGSREPSPAVSAASGFDPSRKMFFSRGEVCGALAMWAIRQSPYPMPDNLEAAVASMFDALPDDGDWFWATESQLREMVELICLNDETIVAWNQPKSGHTAEIVFSSRYDEPNPDDDFIDLHALANNICRTLLADQYDDASGIEARSDETLQAAQPERREPVPSGDAQTPNPPTKGR